MQEFFREITLNIFGQLHDVLEVFNYERTSKKQAIFDFVINGDHKKAFYIKVDLIGNYINLEYFDYEKDSSFEMRLENQGDLTNLNRWYQTVNLD